MADVPAATPQERHGAAPQERHGAAPRKPKRAASRAREITTSAVLITFTALVGIACVVALASTLTQTRMSTLVIDGVPLSIWKLDDIRTQWTDIRDSIDDLSTEITEAEKQRTTIVGNEAAANQTFNAKNTTLIIRIDELMFRLDVDEALAHKVSRRKEKPDDGGVSPAHQYGQIAALREQALKDHPELTPLFTELETAYKEYAVARGARLEAIGNKEAMIQKIKSLQDAVSGSRTSLETLYRQINPKFSAAANAPVKPGEPSVARPSELDDATRARIENALYELQSGLLGSVINLLVTTQPDILTLTLVILMGILGSSLQMTYAFFKRHQIEAVGAYMLRVCVGAITALVIFIVAKAGVPVIADASKLGGDAAINPYFVSFLAIISGLMSENAIASVQNQGARFFGAENAVEPPRWARQDLRPAFTAANRDPERVKRLLQVKDEEFEGWVSGKDPMPANAQMIVAGVLQTPARDLFTDIPPDQAGTTS
jgi:hypothetical protein